MTVPPRDARSPFVAAVVLATLLALALRCYGITAQVVLDDEWHAIHKLLTASYSDIFSSFGAADHSIPLTLFYKAMADAMGLAEGRLRALQIICGVATVPVAAWIAWRATRDAAAAALLAFLVAGAPFLVMWSRFARPYAMTPLLALVCVACLWRWRTRRTAALGVGYALSAVLLTWLHPLCGLFPALAGLFVFAEDVAVPRHVRPRPSRSTLALGAATGMAMALLLAAPITEDFESLAVKAGGDQPSLDTFERMLSIFWGGLPTPAFLAAMAATAWGLVVLLRCDRRLGLYLAVLAAVPPAVVTLLGALYVNAGQNLGRYVLPVQLIVLFLGSLGAVSLVRALAGRRAEAAAWAATAILAVGYLAATPTIRQVATLGPWYAHLDYHWDYRHRWMEAKLGDANYTPPAFYRKLGRMAPGSATVVETPFVWPAPRNDLAFYATFHRQREIFGMIHDVCIEGPRLGEPPPDDRRFRFRSFIFLTDVPAVRRSGARYLVLHRDLLPALPFVRPVGCLEKLTALYGAPVELDDRVAVFDLRPGDPPPKLQ